MLIFPRKWEDKSPSSQSRACPPVGDVSTSSLHFFSPWFRERLQQIADDFHAGKVQQRDPARRLMKTIKTKAFLPLIGFIYRYLASFLLVHTYSAHCWAPIRSFATFLVHIMLSAHESESEACQSYNHFPSKQRSDFPRGRCLIFVVYQLRCRMKERMKVWLDSTLKHSRKQNWDKEW